AMTKKSLSELHSFYLRNGIEVYLGGDFEATRAIKMLSALPQVSSVDLPLHFQQIEWARREYHERAFPDLSQYEYLATTILGVLSTEESIFGSFLNSALVDFAAGPLYQWLRHDKQWVYGVHGFTSGIKPMASIWGLQIDLPDAQHLVQIRDELGDRLRTFVENDDAIGQALSRHNKSAAFKLQTIGATLTAAIGLVNDYGRIYSEREIAAILDTFREKSVRMSAFEKHWDPSQRGEFLATPLLGE
ncbi:MAG TPA: insulinase family protein, partial [Candidatus Paceibacterota bacterium]|nr:insulinase family protein [Candidatus Paceibacterota bacterium]